MSAPVIDLKLRFRPGFQAEMDKAFRRSSMRSHSKLPKLWTLMYPSTPAR